MALGSLYKWVCHYRLSKPPESDNNTDTSYLVVVILVGSKPRNPETNFDKYTKLWKCIILDMSNFVHFCSKVKSI